MIARHIIFEGRVQGVGFRYTCRELSKGYDVTGSVENLPDGSVEMILSGEKEELEDYLRDLSEDSALRNHIKEMRIRPIDVPDQLRGFRIIR